VRVVIHPADLGACGHYRLVWPGEACAAQGHDVEVSFDATYRMLWKDTLAGPTVIGLFDPIDADVVVLQRPLTRNRFEFVQALQAEGIAVVVEVDDDFHAIHPRNPAWKGANPLTDPDAHRDWLMRACAIADLVTVSTPALAERYGAHGRVMVLDNYVPERYCTIERPEHDGVRVGWSGSVSTHPGDLEVTEGAIAHVLTRHDAELAVVGTGTRVAAALQHEGPVTASGWVPIDEYPDALATLDVGLVPLKPSPFNEAKSHLKGLEYASVGVPFVATPTGPYQSLAFAGLGWTAETPASWRYLVGELIQDHDHRQSLSDAYRAEVAAEWTIEANAWRWAEAWSHAVAHRAPKVAA
jgi:glycosyltransferase involved in cell wall biosynthesis